MVYMDWGGEIGDRRIRVVIANNKMEAKGECIVVVCTIQSTFSSIH